MTSPEFDSLLAKMTELWPDWERNNEQVTAWRESIMWAKYDDARFVAKELFADQPSNWRRPSLKAFRRKLRTVTGKRTVRRAANLAEPTCVVRCHEAPPGLPGMEGWEFHAWPRWCRPEDLPETSDGWQRLAVAACTQCKEIYGGGMWIVVQKPPAQEDDGLRGKPALAAAIDRIMAGSDGPGKRYIENLENQRLQDGRSPAHLPSGRTPPRSPQPGPASPVAGPAGKADEPDEPDEFDTYMAGGSKPAKPKEEDSDDSAIPF